MKQFKYSRLLGLILALGLVLSACGDKESSSMSVSDSTLSTSQPQESAAAMVPQTTQSPEEQTGYGYTVEWTELSISEGMLERLFFLGEKLMIEISTETGTRGVYDLESGQVVSVDTGNVLTVAPENDALWYCVEEGSGLVLHKVSAENGSSLETVTLSDSEGLYPYTMAVGNDGSFYLMGAGWLQVYSSEGKQVSSFSLEEEQGISLVRLSDGQVILSTQTLQEDGTYRGSVKQLNTESIGASLTEQSNIYHVYPGWEGVALLSDGGNLYALDMESNAMTAVLDWIDTDVNPETLVSVVAKEQETIYLISSTQEETLLGTLQREPVSEGAEKTTVSMGYYVEDPELSSIISALAVEFNGSQSEFRVHLVNYSNYSDGLERIGQDAEDLDLILTDLDYLEDVELSDLGGLFDETVGEDTLMPCVYQALISDGTVKGIPLYFTVDTLLGTKSTLGEEQGWTPAEFLEVVTQQSESAVLQYSNAYDALDLLVSHAGEYITDYASLLNAVQGIPVNDEEIYNLEANLADQAIPCLKDGSLLLESVNISSFSDLLALSAALDGDGVLKGYPTDIGNGGILVGATQENLAIPDSSEYKQEAWTFLKQLLTSEGMKQYQMSHGFPVLESAYSEAEEEAMQGIVYVDSNGEQVTTGGQVFLEDESYEVEPLTESQADAFREYLNGSCGFSGNTQTLAAEARSALKSVLESGTDPAEAAKEIQN